MSAVWAVVVTHNRKPMLRECLAALEAQTRPPDRVLVVDNASTDGTGAMLERDYRGVEVLTMPRNEGGAGGFHEGMRRAHGDGAEWIWLLDDDTIAAPDALAELLAAPARLEPLPRPLLLASKVVWRDGRIHPQNYGGPERRRVQRLVDGAEHGLMPLRFATFVSLLVHGDAVERHGLPLKDFFIWSDDVEYTSRIVLGGEPAYLVPTSVAVHRTESPATWRSAPPQRFYYHVRNTVLIVRARRGNRRVRLVFVWVLLTDVIVYLRRHPSASSLAAIARGLRDGLARR